MKKQKIVALALATTLAGGLGALTACGSDGTTNDAKPNASVSSPAEESPATPETPTASATPDSPADLTLAPGAAGPVRVGMSKAEVAATGLFGNDTATGVEGCPVHGLTWIKPFSDTFDVQALKNGEVASIGVRKAGPTTASGLGIGSTLAEVLAANAGAKTVEAGYGQTGVLVRDAATNGWIGFLFDADLKDVKNTDPVSFIELTEGEKPSLMRDGC